MEVQEIEIFIERDGKFRIETHGRGGAEMRQILSARLEKALGTDIEKEETTSGIKRQEAGALR